MPLLRGLAPTCQSAELGLLLLVLRLRLLVELLGSWRIDFL